MPTAEAVAAMVESGWSHGELMVMPARDFSTWFHVWAERRKREAEALEEAAAART